MMNGHPGTAHPDSPKSETFDRHIVHLVSDRAPQRDATARVLRAAGHSVCTYVSASDFLDAPRPLHSGCVVLEMPLCGPGALEVQRVLKISDEPLPVVFLGGEANVTESVQAMKAGAIDVLTRADSNDLLLQAVSVALARDAEERRRRDERSELAARYSRLSPREREIFAHIVSGKLNKQIGYDLGISLQTTKVHRHRVFQKMKANSIVELAHMAERLGVAPVGLVS